MSNNFYVGQEVVCVDDYQDRFCDYQDRFCIGHDPTWKDLKNGVVYTVRAVRIDEDTGLQELHLNEIIRRPHPHHGRENGYLSPRFRPAVKTDISVFTAMLNPAPTRVDA